MWYGVVWWYMLFTSIKSKKNFAVGHLGVEFGSSFVYVVLGSEGMRGFFIILCCCLCLGAPSVRTELSQTRQTYLLLRCYPV